MDKYTSDNIDMCITSVKQNADYLEKILDNVITAHTGALDQIMSEVYNDIIQADEPADAAVEKYFLKLSNCLYFLGERFEKLGLYEDLSDAACKEKYNKSYLDKKTTSEQLGNKSTVAELNSIAQESSKYENAVNILYSKAYKIVKYKIDAANTMIATLSKILSKRMQDNQLSMQSERKSRVLNEG